MILRKKQIEDKAKMNPKNNSVKYYYPPEPRIDWARNKIEYCIVEKLTKKECRIRTKIKGEKEKIFISVAPKKQSSFFKTYPKAVLYRRALALFAYSLPESQIEKKLNTIFNHFENLKKEGAKK